ncbi:MAG: NifU family protein [Patescibacteria group bacterium]|jgi:Fe-S cluster biogenesis protein NfuA
MKIEDKIKKSLESVRPDLQADGGDVEFVSFDEKTGTANLRLVGMCSHCPMAQITLQQGIGEILKKEIPEVKKISNI